MSKHEDLKLTSIAYGRQWTIPADRISRVEPTLARADVVMQDGERLPVRETVEKINELLRQLAAKKKNVA